MQIKYVSDVAGLAEVREALDGASRIALDCEAAGYHRYSDRLCLIQLTVGGRTFLLDPLSVDPSPILGEALTSPSTEVIMHGADYDVRLIDRDLGIRVSGLFDTQIGASLLGAEATGLGALLGARFGVQLSKKFQKADWAQRPLPPAMIEYAALDTAHLEELGDQLREELRRAGRLEWAAEEFRELEKVRFEESREADPVLRVRAARDLTPREVDRLREALIWRDRIARESDRAPFRVAGDDVLVEVARTDPASVSELAAIRGMGRGVARESGGDLLGRLAEVARKSEREVRGYPSRAQAGNGSYAGRPSPEVEERIARLKAVRNAKAAALGIDRGTLLSNAVLQAIAESPPADPAALARAPGIRRWQAELLARDLLDVL
jgi:ribonuclease D